MNFSSRARQWTGRAIILGLALGIGGCANMPDAKVNYYLAKSAVSFKVTRMYLCDSDNHVLVTNAVTYALLHSADKDAKNTIDLAKLHGTFSDTDFKVEFFDDGRLKSINSSSTGQGEAILKSIITTAAAIVAFGDNTFKQECAAIKTVAGDKPLTLTFVLDDASPTLKERQDLKPDKFSQALIDAHELATIQGTAYLEVKKTECRKPVEYEPKGAAKDSGATVTCPPPNIAAKYGEQVLAAREPALVQFEVSAGAPGVPEQKIWDEWIPIAQLGVDYPLPLPAPKAFGKGAIAVTFQESGKLGSFQVITNTGAAQGMNALNAGLAELAPTTTAKKAEQVKAEADLLAQQQRLATCRADPKNCK